MSSQSTFKRIWECANLFTQDNLTSVISTGVVSLAINQKLASPNTTVVAAPPSDDSLFCTSCQIKVTDVSSHYKGDFHRVNTKLKSAGANPISLEEFESLQVSDDSDSETEDDRNTNDAKLEETLVNKKIAESSNTSSNPLEVQASTGSGRITFITKDGKTLTVWKNMLLNGKSNTVGQYALAALKLSEPVPTSLPSEATTNPSQNQSSNHSQSITPHITHPFQWIVLLCQGGFFAGAVFRYDKVLKHKRIARYTVRRKQGGSQASKDASKGGIHSAGASIRRYNETKLREEIAEIMDEWRQEFNEASVIFLHAPSFNNASFFFEKSPITRRDPRVRNIPIITSRPSFVELQRIHMILSTVEISTFEGLKEIVQSQEEVNSQSEIKSLSSSIESNITSLTEGEYSNWANSSTSSISNTGESNVQETDLLLEAIKANDKDLVRKLMSEDDYQQPIPSNPDELVWPLMLAVVNKNLEMAKLLIECGENLDGRSPKYQLKTALHMACELSQDKIVLLLLEEGANPGISDLYNHKAYDLCKEKSTRNVLRRFAGENEDLWDYQAAHIPPLTEEMENQAKSKEAEKRKKKKANQKEKKKQSKIEEEEQRLKEKQRKKANEEDDLARQAALERTRKILNMTEREKRALAAERRLNPSATLCDNCGKKITTTPFERLSFKYCTTECVIEHKRLLEALQASSSK